MILEQIGEVKLPAHDKPGVSIMRRCTDHGGNGGICDTVYAFLPDTHRALVYADRG